MTPCPHCADTGTARYLVLPDTVAGLYLLQGTRHVPRPPCILTGPCARCRPAEAHTWARTHGIPLRDRQGFLLSEDPR